jgi:hypothetical protein
MYLYQTKGTMNVHAHNYSEPDSHLLKAYAAETSEASTPRLL